MNQTAPIEPPASHDPIDPLPYVAKWLLLILPAVLLYAPIVGYDFIEIDDGGQIFENPYVKSLSLEGVIALFSTPVVGMYQPLTSIVNAIVVSLFGEDASAFRILSLILHSGNTALFYLIAVRLFQNSTKALITALILSCHPLMVEPVVWISALSTLWFTLFFLVSLLFYLEYLDSHRVKNYWASLLSFTVGALFKVQIVPLVGVLLLADYVKRERIDINALKEKVPFMMIGLTFLYIAVQFRGETGGFPDYDYAPELLTPGQLLWYPTKLLLPFHLGIQYDWPEKLWNPLNLFGWTVALLLPIVLTLFRQKRVIIFGVLFYLGNILLHTALFTQFLGPYADRYAYLSSFGLLLVLIGAIPSHYFSQWLWVFIIAILGYAILTSEQIKVWTNTITVWSNNLQHQEATFSYGMRGALLLKEGQAAQAKLDFQRVADDPDIRLEGEKYAYLYTQLGILTAAEAPKKAVEYFSLALDYEQSPNAYLNLAEIYSRTGDVKAAERAYKQALELFPDHIGALQGVSNLHFFQNQFALVLPILDRLIELEPHQPMHLKKRTFIHMKLNNFSEAKRDYERLLKQIPHKNQQDPTFIEIRRMIEMYQHKESAINPMQLEDKTTTHTQTMIDN